MKISIVSRSGKGATLIDLDEDAPVRDLKAKYGRLRRVAPERQRFTLPAKAGEARGVALEDGKRLSDYGLKDGDVLQFKDLGPQIGYQTVFLLEYAGPLIIYPLFHFFPGIFYPWASEEQLSRPRDPAQVMAVFYWSFHYVKRLLETVLVHKFGHDTMPLANLFRNCGYYWGFAAWVSYFVNHPLYTPPWEMQTLAAFGLALGCQVANLKCHVILSELRKPGERGYKIPRGFLFDFITCPNYMTEVLGWLLFAVATQTLPALVFAVAGTYQMAVWAIQKHKRLKKIFNGQDGNEKYPFRWIMLPPLF